MSHTSFHLFLYHATVIWRPYEGEVKAPLTGNMWTAGSNGSWQVHLDAVITTLIESSSSHFSATLQNSEVDVPIPVSPSINGSGRLVRVVDGWANSRITQTRSRTLKGLQTSYREYFST